MYAIYWEYIFKNHLSDKGLVSSLYKECSKTNSEKPNNPIRKWAKDMKTHFIKENIQISTST